jgi:hypothetical protein
MYRNYPSPLVEGFNGESCTTARTLQKLGSFLIMTTSENPNDLRYCFDNGALGCFVTPVDLPRFIESVETLVKCGFEAVTLPPGQGEAS